MQNPTFLGIVEHDNGELELFLMTNMLEVDEWRKHQIATGHTYVFYRLMPEKEEPKEPAIFEPVME